MYSGFITPKRTLPAVGVHQRFDSKAHRLITPFVTPGSFPPLRHIKHFEGFNGPDGIKSKSPHRNNPGHWYDPATGEGEIVILVENHIRGLTAALQARDNLRSAFEAAWLAHYVCDGLTPAHHFSRRASENADTLKTIRQNVRLLGAKESLTAHFNFELGVAASLVGRRIKVELSEPHLAQARQIGALAYFQHEARSIAALKLYERFIDTGWDAHLARQIRTRLAPQTVQTIAIIWLLAYLDAEQTRALAR